jgi:hypothetical protein
MENHHMVVTAHTVKTGRGGTSFSPSRNAAKYYSQGQRPWNDVEPPPKP